MKYIDADKIRAEIERRMETCDANSKTPDQLLWAELGALISFLDTLEEPDKDLKEAAEEYSDKYCSDWAYRLEYEDAFIAGAKWQAEKCDEETSKLLYGERQTAYIYGWHDCKEQMLKDAVEGYVCYGSKGAYIETDFLGEYDTDVYGNPGNKVKIIITKEDKK